MEVVVCGRPDRGLRAAVGLTLGERAAGPGEVALGARGRKHSPAPRHITCHHTPSLAMCSGNPHVLFPSPTLEMQEPGPLGAEGKPVLTSSATRKW